MGHKSVNVYADSKPSLIDLEADNNATGRKRQTAQRERLSERGPAERGMR